MATSNRQSDDAQTSVILGGSAGVELPEPSRDTAAGGMVTPTVNRWVNAVCYVVAGVSAVGLLLVVLGVYVTHSDLLILIGASVVSLGGVGWIILAALAITGIIRGWLATDGKVDESPPVARVGRP